MSRRLIDLTEDDLAQLLDQRLAEHLAELRAEAAPALDDRSTLAKALGISPKGLDRLRRLPGFPELRLGDVPRFERAAVLGWLRARGNGEGLRAIEGGKR